VSRTTRADAAAAGSEIRDHVLRELERSGRSRYWMAQRVADDPRAGVTADTVYRYLRGEGDTTGAVIASMLRALGLRITSAAAKKS
jgi:DNA-binding phage protein